MSIFGRYHALAWVIITGVVVLAPIILQYAGVWSLPAWLMIIYDGVVSAVTLLFVAFIIWGIYGDH